jgi:hypothetical protein
MIVNYGNTVHVSQADSVSEVIGCGRGNRQGNMCRNRPVAHSTSVQRIGEVNASETRSVTPLLTGCFRQRNNLCHIRGSQSVEDLNYGLLGYDNI